MFKLIGTLLKVTLFAIVILVLANVFEWRGKTISDQVKTQLSHAERLPVTHQVKRWAGGLVKDSNTGAQNRARQKDTDLDQITASERQKLKSLIEELNTSSKD